MIIIPAIDLKKSQVVRLTKGRFEETTSYGEKPEFLVREFIARGVIRIHVVVLLGARDGKILEEDATAIGRIIQMRDILKKGSCILQMGGGIRRMTEIRSYLDAGIDLLVISTALMLPLVMECGFSMSDIRRFYRSGNRQFNLAEDLPEVDLIDQLDGPTKDKIIVGVDIAGSETALSGWMVTVPLRPSYVINRMAEKGFSRFMLTDVSRDGTLEGVNLERFSEIFDGVSKNVAGLEFIIAGGISGDQDIARIKDSGLPITGVVIGKALYEKKVELHQLLRKYQETI